MELYYLISITDRDKAGGILAICEELRMPFVLTNLASGTATSEHLSL